LAFSGCETIRTAEALDVPPERTDCIELLGVDARPTIPPEYFIDWTRVQTVDQARAEHEAFVTRVRERERLVAMYVIRLADRGFACADDARGDSEFMSRLPARPVAARDER